MESPPPEKSAFEFFRFTFPSVSLALMLFDLVTLLPLARRNVSTFAFELSVTSL